MSSQSTTQSSGNFSSRRPAPPPKSNRKQYTACGACRLRRVKCDLRELQEAAGGDEHQICSNCAQRGINCVDEYVELKAARRQIGLMTGEEGSPQSSVSPEAAALLLPHPEFFSSTFFRQFALQNPIFDSHDFRFISTGQTEGISVERRLLATALLAWATSYGLGDRGIEIFTGAQGTGMGQPDLSGDGIIQMRTNSLVYGILNLIDSHGTMRNPSWDGVRLLLLIWPLTYGTQRQLERVTMFESILSQVHALGQLGSSTPPGEVSYQDSLVRARVFWYAFVREGVVNALNGSRLVMHVDDLDGFHHTLPPSKGQPPSLSTVMQALVGRSHPRPFLLYQLATRLYDLTLQVASICHKIHAVLASPRAQQTSGGTAYLKFDDLKAIWDGLDLSLSQFEGVRASGMWNGALDQMCPVEDVDAFVSGWQIFIFEIHNIVRESLRRRVTAEASAPTTSSHPHTSFRSVFDLYSHATQKSRFMLPTVLTVLKRHLRTPNSTLFQFDAHLIRDGCVFAGLMLAQSDLEVDANTEPLPVDLEEGIDICLRALGEMRWIFSASIKAKETVVTAWDARQMRDRQRRGHSRAHASGQYDLPQGSSPQWSPSPHGPPYQQYSSMHQSQDAAYNLQGQDQQTWTNSSSINSVDPYYAYRPEEWFNYDATN